MRYAPISPELFVKNRNEVLYFMNDNSCAVVFSNPQVPRNGDQFHPFRQNSDLFYLTGIEQEKTSLIMVRNAENDYETWLFILEPKPEVEQWEGKKLTKDEASKISGIAITNILYTNEFDDCWRHYRNSNDIDNIYFNNFSHPRLQSDIKMPDQIWRENEEIDINILYHKQIHNLANILASCRLEKRPEEIALIRRACQITKDGFMNVLSQIKPNMREYEIEAILTYEFLRQGASGHAFEPIVASGANTCFLHYNKNDQCINSGDLILMDFGAEYANYASDCTRTIPANGRYSKRQKEIYEAVHKAFNATRSAIKPGIDISDYHKICQQTIEQELLMLGLLTKKDIEEQERQYQALAKYFMHNVSHFIGLDTHDVGDRNRILKPGMIVSCEPGIYCSAEGIGIRLENTILVTENGCEDLMENIPMDLEEIENLINS